MSTFNPTQLLNTQFSDAFDTTFIPIPENDDGYVAVIKKYEIRTPKESVILEVHWDIDDPEVMQVTGRDTNTVRQAIFLDMTPHGTLDVGKGQNVSLGRMREALGPNKPGQPWSLGNIQGQVGRVFVKHRTDDEGNTLVDVRRVTAV